MEFSISPLFFLWLMAVVAFVCAYIVGRRREKAARRGAPADTYRPGIFQ
jgi:hypothetical protein